jgi:hypothetical protein
MPWIGALIVVFVFAAFVNPDTAIYMWSIVFLMLVVGGVVAFFKIIAAVKAGAEKRRKAKAFADGQAQRAEEIAAEKAERYPRLAQAFEPVIEHQEALNTKLQSWLQGELQATEKPEYQKHLSAHLEKFEVVSASECNSEFLDVVQQPGVDVAILCMGNFVLAPHELLDKSDWEKRIVFDLESIRREDREDVWFEFQARLNLEQALEFVDLALAESLVREHLTKAVDALALPQGSTDAFIQAHKTQTASGVVRVGDSDYVNYVISNRYFEDRYGIVEK